MAWPCASSLAGRIGINAPLGLKTSALITIGVTYRSAEDSAKFAKTAVKLYSLREQDYINTMRFRSEVYSILCSKRMLVVVRAPHLFSLWKSHQAVPT